MAWEKKTPEEMDAAALDAQNALVDLEVDHDALEAIRNWMLEWYTKCGWKRLAKIIAKGM